MTYRGTVTLMQRFGRACSTAHRRNHVESMTYQLSHRKDTQGFATGKKGLYSYRAGGNPLVSKTATIQQHRSRQTRGMFRALQQSPRH
jgi:hypothetical protein